MGKSKKKKDLSEFTETSTRYCDLCNDDIHISFGGEKNWKQHIESKNHLKNVPKSPPPSMDDKPVKIATKLTSFFTKLPLRRSRSPQSAAGVAPSSMDPPRLSEPAGSSHLSISARDTDLAPSVAIDTDLGTATLPIDVDLADGPSQPVSNAARLLARVHAAALQLPTSIPIGSFSDSLSRFSGNPEVAFTLEEYESMWEMVDKELNRVIGFEKSIADIAYIIRRGKLGMDGMCNWLSICLNRADIPHDLLEPKLGRLLEAITTLIPPPSANLTAPTELNIAQKIKKSKGKKPARTTKCPGYLLVTSDGESAYGAYPFGLHMTRNIPWSVILNENTVCLVSCDCTHEARFEPNSDSALPCSSCYALHNHNIIMGIRHRAALGPHENTPFGYLGVAHLQESLARKNSRIEQLHLTGLNTARSLSSLNRALGLWKRVAVAISEQKIDRLHALFRVQLQNGAGPAAILNRTNQAALLAYKAKGYEEADYQRAFLFWKLGGRAVATLANHTAGTPSIDTARRHVKTTPLATSPGVPTVAEIRTNISIAFAHQEEHGAHTIGMTMPIDEIKLQERLRWDPHSNMILGICREHGHECVLEFRSMTQAEDVVEKLISKKIHFAAEATVIAACLLTDDAKQYNARPFVISGSCKRETVSAQQELLQTASQVLAETQSHQRRRLYCIASDGDARRRNAMARMTLINPLASTSPIHPILANLRLFNILCGKDDLTGDLDWKHILKRFRNTLLRLRGIEIDNTIITTSIIRKHLKDSGAMSDSAITAVLSPNDKQDVVLMIQLLNALATLPPARSDDNQSYQSSRRVLRLLGTLYRHILLAYMQVSLSLHEQLAHLSAAAHIALALYSQFKGDFVPIQLYFDVMSMIKNVYFCIAKTQVDNPDGKFWIIILGTDGLEKVFGTVRTMVGSDSHADQLQLTNRIDGAVQCVKILEQHPEWRIVSRRITVKALEEQGQDISRKLDHITPRSWTGDVHVKNIILRSCWQEGRGIAEAELSEFAIKIPFSNMETVGGFDILCPFGGNNLVLVKGAIDAGEAEETEEERDEVLASSPSTAQPTAVTNDEDMVPDIEDIAGADEAASLAVQNSSPRKVEPWIVVGATDNSAGKAQHKSTILRFFSNPMAVANSSDRLKRVRGFSKYNEPSSHPSAFDINTEEAVTSFLTVEDPVLSLVKSNGHIFLAVMRVLEIRVDTSLLNTISPQRLHEPNVKVRGQVMGIAPRISSAEAESESWETTGLYEPGGGNSGLRNIEGRWLDITDPAVSTRTQGANIGSAAYVFRATELRAAAAVLYERLRPELHRLPHITATDTFPYRFNDRACFIYCVWKYNLKAHLEHIHLVTNLALYEEHFALHENESILMMRIFKAKPRTSKKKKVTRAIEISEGHSSRLALCLPENDLHVPANNDFEVDHESTALESDEANSQDEWETTSADMRSIMSADGDFDEPAHGSTNDNTTLAVTAPTASVTGCISESTPMTHGSITEPSAGTSNHPRAHLRRRRAPSTDTADLAFCSECDQSIPPSQLLLCSAPKCPERLMVYYAI
ncbi:hypothetical protein HWV62_25070 [Athelia sp. TMB]|nr:hypothetical protein HWV62_25070 [Athelia sp. TMB]